MAAYLIAKIHVTDPDGLRKYGEMAYPTLIAAGGRILASSEQPEVIEGDWQPGILVLIEFPNAGDIRRWLESPEYQPARQVRHQSAKTDLILIGCDHTL